MPPQTASIPQPPIPKPRFEIGLYSFAELTPDPHTGRQISPAQRLHNLLEEIELADQVGLTFSPSVNITGPILFRHPRL